MKQSEANFERLKEEFYFKTSAPKAAKILRKRGTDMKYMRRLLRHHEEKAVSDRETWKRDYFDCLLEYYSMLELAIVAGLIEALPEKDKTQAIAALSHPAVRVYYREHYPIVLPIYLLDRLEREPQFVGSDTSGELANIFLQYVPLAYYAEADEDIECFLWFLDGGSRAGYDYHDTLRILRSRKRLIESLTKLPEDKNALDASVEGFGKFLDFCLELDTTLQRSAKYPTFQKMLFENHSYWFREMGEKLGKKVFRALSNYVEFKETDTFEDHYFAQAKFALKNLLSGKYSVEPWQGFPGETTGNSSIQRSTARSTQGRKRKVTSEARGEHLS